MSIPLYLGERALQGPMVCMSGKKMLVDLSKWRKVTDMTTPLGTTYELYESLDESKIAQVDPKSKTIYLIIEKGKIVYLNSKTMDGLKRMKEIKEHLKGKEKRPTQV